MSDLGTLSQCMMEGDADVLRRSRQLLRGALLASICLETAVLALLLLWPLVAPGVLPTGVSFTPAVPIHTPQAPKPLRSADPYQMPHPSADARPTVYQPPVVTVLSQNSRDLEPPNVEERLGDGGLPSGVSGGSDIGPAGPVAPPRNSARNSAPVKVSEGVMEARLIHRVEPIYPRIAQDSHLTGIVRLRASIGPDGNICQLEVVSGNSIFVPSAVTAIRQWRYEPTRLNGLPVEVETDITVEFMLR